ncbi:PREDICTED: oocyte zinc finger protein XlCOF29-like, partial [Nanorana parkeri]|uniref:oocyte zinc finger protein XlCOF29-like n=1 Tax=Nanorana parkeri TaxID=125878 RepID=UPI0008549F46
VSKKMRRTSERSRQRKATMKPKARAAKDRTEMSEKILNLTMEIISVLAGEECSVMTKSGEPVVPGNCPPASGGPISASGGQTLKQERQNDQKILDLTFRIIQLLTGEGPGGSEDAASSHVGKGKSKGQQKSVIVERSRPSTFGGKRCWCAAG